MCSSTYGMDIIPNSFLFVQAGKINCDNEKSLCKRSGVSIGKSARLFIYSYATAEKGSLHEYSGEHDAKSLKTFCQEHLPRFSKRVDISQFSFPLNVLPNLPQVLLLSSKKDTPAMWRAISGMFRNRIIFYDAEVSNLICCCYCYCCTINNCYENTYVVLVLWPYKKDQV